MVPKLFSSPSHCTPGLFAELDCRPDLGIINYGVSMTTLEDVFLRLEAEAEVDQTGKISTYLNWFKASLFEISVLRSAIYYLPV